MAISSYKVQPPSPPWAAALPALPFSPSCSSSPPAVRALPRRRTRHTPTHPGVDTHPTPAHLRLAPSPDEHEHTHAHRAAAAMDYDRYDAFLHHIFKQTQGDAWFRPGEENLSAGVALRVGYGACLVFILSFPSNRPLFVQIISLFVSSLVVRLIHSFVSFSKSNSSSVFFVLTCLSRRFLSPFRLSSLYP